VKTYVGISGRDSEKVVESAVEHVACGYRALKMHLRVPNRELVEMVRAVRSAVGDEIQLMVDVHTTRDVASAIELGRELQTLGVRWLESPTAPEDVGGQAEIARALDKKLP
jgi:L-alanine-DL-glutamate epimerase-like enolase superfamily enzyme